MGVRWQITFKTNNPDNDHTGVVKVYDSNYSGDPIILEPAVNPFYTCRQMQDISDPVVSDSGYLRVIDNDIAAEHIEDMHPLGALDRPVEFYFDNVLKWRGYISPESFTVDWEPAPREVAFPLVGALSVLDSVSITKNNTNRQSIAAFLYEILDATGFTWSKIIMATQMKSLDDGTSYDVPELRLELSRYNFMQATSSDNIDDVDWTPISGDSYLQVLQDICRYFCWTAIQEGDVLYLSSLRTDLTSYPKAVTWAALEALAEDPTNTPEGISDDSSRPVVALSSIEMDGINHHKSIKNGVKKITIQSNLNNRDDFIPKIGYKGNVLTDWKENYRTLNPSVNYQGHCLFLDPSKEPVQMFMFEEVYDELTEQWYLQMVDWSEPTENYNPGCGAIVRAFTHEYDPDDTPDPNPVTIYRNMLRLRRGGFEHLMVPSTSVLASIRSVAAGFFPAGGALFISGMVYNQYPSFPDITTGDPDGLTQVGAFLNNLYLRVRLGGKYFNGTSWQDFPTTFPVEVIAINSPASIMVGGPGKIKNTSPGGYEGAEGYCIPIEENMDGTLVVDFFSWDTNSQTNADKVNTIFISELDIRFVNEYLSKETHGVRLTALTGTPFKDNLDVALNLSSCIGLKQGQSLLFWDGEPIGERNLFEYVLSAGGREAYQPEYWLLDALMKAYSKPSVWLELETSLDATLLMWSLIGYNNKKYLITTCETDYADEHTKMIIACYE